jgi:hypothetical protein
MAYPTGGTQNLKGHPTRDDTDGSDIRGNPGFSSSFMLYLRHQGNELPTQ